MAQMMQIINSNLKLHNETVIKFLLTDTSLMYENGGNDLILFLNEL